MCFIIGNLIVQIAELPIKARNLQRNRLNDMLRLMVLFLCLQGFYSCTGISQHASDEELSVPIFVYHRFGDNRYPSTNVDLVVFEQQMRYLSEHGYQVFTFGDAVQKIEEGFIPEKSVVITIDDGYESFYDNAFPILRKYGFSATLFVNTAYVGYKDYMRWEQLKELQNSGIEIGNHSHRHPYFLNMENVREGFVADVSMAQRLFEAHLDEKPTVLSYPYGESNSEMHHEALKMGFYAAAVQCSGVYDAYRNRFAIPRFPMGGAFATLSGFISKLEMLPLRVSEASFVEDVISRYKFRVATKIIDYSIQCFIDGKPVEVMKSGEGFYVEIPDKSHRRTLVTITAKGELSNKYHWYSFSKVNTALSE